MKTPGLTSFHYIYLDLLPLRSHKTREKKKVSEALLEGNMTSRIWHRNEENKHKRIIVLTRAVRCKSKEREIDGALKAVKLYLCIHHDI